MKHLSALREFCIIRALGEYKFEYAPRLLVKLYIRPPDTNTHVRWPDTLLFSSHRKHITFMTAAAVNLHFSDLPCFPIRAALPPARKMKRWLKSWPFSGQNNQKPHVLKNIRVAISVEVWEIRVVLFYVGLKFHNSLKQLISNKFFKNSSIKCFYENSINLNAFINIECSNFQVPKNMHFEGKKYTFRWF